MRAQFTKDHPGVAENDLASTSPGDELAVLSIDNPAGPACRVAGLKGPEPQSEPAATPQDAAFAAPVATDAEPLKIGGLTPMQLAIVAAFFLGVFAAMFVAMSQFSGG